METKLEVIVSYDTKEQEFLTLPYNEDAMYNAFTLLEYITKDFGEDEKNDIVKLSNCVLTGKKSEGIVLPEWYLNNNGKLWFNLDDNLTPLGGLHIDHYVENMQLLIDHESVTIQVDRGEDVDPIHVCYWNIEEVAEDTDVAISMVNAVNLFHMNKKELLNRINFQLC